MPIQVNTHLFLLKMSVAAVTFTDQIDLSLSFAANLCIVVFVFDGCHKLDLSSKDPLLSEKTLDAPIPVPPVTYV